MTEIGAATQFRRKLLPVTLGHAATNVPAYRTAYAATRWDRVVAVSDLAALPFTDKATVQADWRSFICPGLRLAHVQHTSGTTGESLFLLRSAEEQAFISTFLADSTRVLAKPATAIVLSEAYHGSSTGIPSPLRVIKGSIIDDRAVENALRLLTLPDRLADHLGPVRVLAGTDTAIRAVTHLAALRLSEPAAAGIEVIHTYGDLLPPSIRRRIEETWAAVVIDRYSMVEHFGGASLLPGTDRYVFDPHQVPEVVDPRTRAPIRSGRGVLVLTSLYPFVQMMPMIRYVTGDAVEITACDDDYAGLQVRILGRLGDCLCDETGQPVLAPSEWRDALETIPGIAFASRRTDLLIPGMAAAIGRPRARFRSNGALTSVTAEIAVDDTGDATVVAAQARAAILDRAPLFAQRVREGRTTFDVATLGLAAYGAA